ncbi:hypothetical protein Anas_00070, partial [Armadillidium nasatum]
SVQLKLRRQWNTCKQNRATKQLLEQKLFIVCKGKLPTLGSKNTISKITNESYYIGGNISYTCPPGLIFNDLRTEINLTCSKNGEEFSYNETKQLPPCNLCSGSFEHANSTSDYDSAKKYETG